VPVSFDELTDLPADGVEHPEHVLVGLSDLGAEEFHHPQETARSHDGEAKGAVEPVLGGGAIGMSSLLTDSIRMRVVAY